MSDIYDFPEGTHRDYVVCSSSERKKALIQIKAIAVQKFFDGLYLLKIPGSSKQMAKLKIKWLDEVDAQMFFVPNTDDFIVASKKFTNALYAYVFYEESMSRYIFRFSLSTFDFPSKGEIGGENTDSSNNV